MEKNQAANVNLRLYKRTSTSNKSLKDSTKNELKCIFRRQGKLNKASKTKIRNIKKKKYVSMEPLFHSCFYKILKEHHPRASMSKNAVLSLNTFISDIFERLAVQAGFLSIYSKRQTITKREIHASAKLILPVELSKHAINEGAKAVALYSKSKL